MMTKHQVGRGLVMLYVLVLPGKLVAQQTGGDSELQYREGLQAARQQRWEDATELLQKSYKLDALPVTAYVLSVAYSNLDEAASALEYALQALQGTPPLQQKHRKEATKIVRWAAAMHIAPRGPRLRLPMNKDEEDSGRDLLLYVGLSEEDAKAEREFQKKLGGFVDLQQLKVDIKVFEDTDGCRSTDNMSRCLQRLFEITGDDPEGPGATLDLPR